MFGLTYSKYTVVMSQIDWTSAGSSHVWMYSCTTSTLSKLSVPLKSKMSLHVENLKIYRMYMHWPGEPNPVMILEHPLTKVHLINVTFAYCRNNLDDCWI